MNAKRRAASLVLGVLLAACASTPATPTPAGSTQPTPSATPAPSPGPTAVASATATPDPLPSLTTAASGLPAGWHHELVCREDDSTGCQLHLDDAAGREQPGWPVPLAGWCPPENVAVDNDGAVYVACVTGDELTVISSFAVTGSAQSSWPVEAEGQAGPGKVLLVGPDDTVFASTMTGADDRGFSVHAFGPDGHPRAGWPRTLPGAYQGFALAPDGIVVGWWYEDLKEGTLDVQAARTKFTMIGSNGRTLAGWPITSIGTATVPVIAQDGSIFYVSATGKVWGHDRSGNIIDGWPYRLSPWYPPEPPELRPDGRLLFILGEYVLGDGTTPDSQVIVLTTAGRVASGWPYRTNASLAGSRCCTDCYSYFPHVSAADGTLYIAPWDEDGAEILALDRRGQVVTGWPYQLPAGSRAVELAMGPVERIVVTLRDCSAQDGCCDPDATRQITLTPAGDRAP